MQVELEHVYKGLEIPDTWSNTRDFMYWYLDNKLPLIPPQKAKVYATDDARAVAVFKHKNYQIELYIVDNYKSINVHAHPGISLIQFELGLGHILGEGVKTKGWGSYSELKAGQVHGTPTGLHSGPPGSMFLVFQQWPEQVYMSSASVVWYGKLQGPVHAELVNRHYPGKVDFENMRSNLTVKDVLSKRAV